MPAQAQPAAARPPRARCPSGLGAGDYIVEAFTPADLTSSTGQTIPAPYEPAPDPDTDRDDDDNGAALAGQGLSSLPITLSSNDEPTTDGDAGPDSNLTVHFGLFMPASLGNLVWYDANRDGVHDRAEAGVPGEVVTLYDAGAAEPNLPGCCCFPQ